MAKLRAEEGTIDLGADGSTPRAPHAELEDMAVAGATPARDIAAPLRLVAAGTVATGKRAHFVVLEGCPPDDINHTHRIVAVHLNGEEVDRSSKGQ